MLEMMGMKQECTRISLDFASLAAEALERRGRVALFLGNQQQLGICPPSWLEGGGVETKQENLTGLNLFN